jgi:hypothetical protein
VTRSRLAAAISKEADAGKRSGRFLIGTVQRIEENTGQARIYVINERPMSLIATGESVNIVRGSQVVYWDGDPPIAFGLVVTD